MIVSRIVSRRFAARLAFGLACLPFSGALLGGCSTQEMEPETSSPTVLKQSVDRAQEVALDSNISQINQVIGMYRNDNEGKTPASLDELKTYSKFPAEMFVNPVDKKPLLYDPATGKISVQPYDRGIGLPVQPKLPDSNAAGATSQ